MLPPGSRIFDQRFRSPHHHHRHSPLRKAVAHQMSGCNNNTGSGGRRHSPTTTSGIAAQHLWMMVLLPSSAARRNRRRRRRSDGSHSINNSTPSGNNRTTTPKEHKQKSDVREATSGCLSQPQEANTPPRRHRVDTAVTSASVASDSPRYLAVLQQHRTPTTTTRPPPQFPVLPLVPPNPATTDQLHRTTKNESAVERIHKSMQSSSSESSSRGRRTQTTVPDCPTKRGESKMNAPHPVPQSTALNANPPIPTEIVIAVRYHRQTTGASESNHDREVTDNSNHVNDHGLQQKVSAPSSPLDGVSSSHFLPEQHHAAVHTTMPLPSPSRADDEPLPDANWDICHRSHPSSWFPLLLHPTSDRPSHHDCMSPSTDLAQQQQEQLWPHQHNAAMKKHNSIWGITTMTLEGDDPIRCDDDDDDDENNGVERQEQEHYIDRRWDHNDDSSTTSSVSSWPSDEDVLRGGDDTLFTQYHMSSSSQLQATLSDTTTTPTPPTHRRSRHTLGGVQSPLPHGESSTGNSHPGPYIWTTTTPDCKPSIMTVPDLDSLQLTHECSK